MTDGPNDDCNCCVALRFLDGTGAALTPIAWVNRELAEADSFQAYEGSGADLRDVTIDVLGRKRRLVGKHLIWELTIAERDTSPRTLREFIAHLWGRFGTWRQEYPVAALVTGIAVAFILAVIAMWIGRGLWAVVLAPLASMVWLWDMFGRALVPVAVVIGLGSFLLLLARGRPFWAGAAVIFLLLVPGLAAQIAAEIGESLPEKAQWPGDYAAAGEAFFRTLSDQAAGLLEWVEPVWPMIAVLVNALGLTLFASLVDAAIPWGAAYRAARMDKSAIKGTIKLALANRSDTWLTLPLAPPDPPAGLAIEVKPERC